jgi:hypothetical protein
VPAPRIPIWALIVVACIGALGVLAGALLQSWRDDRRWKRETERERDRWQREDRVRWYEKRFAAYDDFSAKTEAIVRVLRRDLRDAPETKILELLEPAEVSLHHLHLLASDEIRYEATAFLQMLMAALIGADAARAGSTEEQIRDRMSLGTSVQELIETIPPDKSVTASFPDMVLNRRNAVRNAIRRDLQSDE